MIIDKMIDKFGIENCLIIIGSSTSLNQRTPFTYEVRKKMINILYPTIKVAKLSNSNPTKAEFDDRYMQQWLEKVKILEKKFKSMFIFYSGSINDISYLKAKFKTSIIVDRKSTGQKFSATKVRQALVDGSRNTLKRLIDKRVIDIAINQLQRF